jgi:uncharacterized phage protein (TIGR01671 family)
MCCSHTEPFIKCSIPDKRPDSFAVLAEWEEYTGLHDKNGREIYEGDIVKINMGRLEDDIFEIVFGGVWEYAAFGITSKSASHEHGYSWDTINPQYAAAMEVIGNIHENPGLATHTGPSAV